MYSTLEVKDLFLPQTAKGAYLPPVFQPRSDIRLFLIFPISHHHSAHRSAVCADTVSYTHLDVYKRQVHSNGTQLVNAPPETQP